MKLEHELHNALRNGSKDKINNVFEKIFNMYFKLGLFVSRQYLDEYSASDITNEVFLSFFESVLKNGGYSIKNIKQYLCVGVKNASIKELQRKQSVVEYDEERDYQIQNHVFVGDKLLNELNKEEQYIITEHVLFDKTFREIANELNKPLNTIKSTYRRACLKARKKLTWAKEQ